MLCLWQFLSVINIVNYFKVPGLHAFHDQCWTVHSGSHNGMAGGAGSSIFLQLTPIGSQLAAIASVIRWQKKSGFLLPMWEQRQPIWCRQNRWFVILAESQVSRTYSFLAVCGQTMLNGGAQYHSGNKEKPNKWDYAERTSNIEQRVEVTSSPMWLTEH